MSKDKVTYRPSYYGGENDPYEAVKVSEAWGLCFPLGSVLKYIRRAGKKEGQAYIQDLKKARTFLDIKIAECEEREPKEPEPIEIHKGLSSVLLDSNDSGVLRQISKSEPIRFEDLVAKG